MPRSKSLLRTAGDAAKWVVERRVLRDALEARGWNATHTALALGMGDASSVIAAVDELGLRTEYEEALRSRGYRRPG
jgi:hypothetical protein